MSLAAKLDRLRGQSHADGDEPLASRLQRLRHTPDRPARRAVPLASLGEALAAHQDGAGLVRCDREFTLSEADGGSAGLTGLPEVWDLPSADWVYIDTETTGLSSGAGNLAFMVGMARYTDGGQLDVRQYVLGSFAAEAHMLHEVLDWIGPRALLVSYNGKSFDVPLLITRLRMHRIENGLAALRQLDLMYGVRRAFRRHWPDCRLQTAEQRLLALYRRDDLPGAEAPAAWRAWLDRGSTAALRRALQHNFQDVVSLALLHRRLVDQYAGNGSSGVDHAAIARAWRDCGDRRQARMVLERAGDALDEAGRMQLAAIYRQQGEWTRAERIWLELQRRGSAEAAVELSKYYEHRLRDYRTASGFAGACETRERDIRLARLQRKMGNNLVLPW